MKCVLTIAMQPIEPLARALAAASAVASGTIEFVHTRQHPQAVQAQLRYEHRGRLWRASVELALQDMRAARRNLNRIDWSVVNEPV